MPLVILIILDEFFNDFSLIFMIFHWFWRHFLVQNHGYVDRKSWIFMKCMQIQGAVAPSSVNRFECPDMFLLSKSRDLANGRDLIRCDSRDATQNLRNIRTFSVSFRIRDIDRPNYIHNKGFWEKSRDFQTVVTL